jgi:hypothetical protein
MFFACLNEVLMSGLTGFLFRRKKAEDYRGKGLCKKVLHRMCGMPECMFFRRDYYDKKMTERI